MELLTPKINKKKLNKIKISLLTLGVKIQP
jgi:hypothetical protein